MDATDINLLTRYAEFIGGLELRQIWMTDTQVSNNLGPGHPPNVDVEISIRGRYHQKGRRLTAFQDYRLVYRLEDKEIGVILVGFGLEYEVDTPIDDELWEVFSDNNLPVNAWPFLREYVSTTLGRMGWTPLFLPALKVGIPPKSSDMKQEDVIELDQ